MKCSGRFLEARRVLNGEDEDAGHGDERREDGGEPFAKAAGAEVAIGEEQKGGDEKEAEENFAVEEAEVLVKERVT